MNTTFQIQIKSNNWESGSRTITKKIAQNDLTKFSNLAEMINKNSGGNTWNWFKRLPDTWDGKRYVIDTWKLRQHMNEHFGYKAEDINLVKEFFLRFTPHGCDGIEWVKFFKVEEIKF